MLVLLPLGVAAQSNFHVAGLVTGTDMEPLPGAHIAWNKGFAVSDVNGRFVLPNDDQDSIHISISFIGCETSDTILTGGRNHHIHVVLQPTSLSLGEILVKSRSARNGGNSELIGGSELSRLVSGTLVGALEHLPGFNAMNIGASAAKPVIRGMSFNRVVVVNNGIKQEGQQWGADHGLEVDPFLTEEVELVRGAAAIEHGSDAMGGILQLSSNTVPAQGLGGKVQMLGKSVNQTAAGSLLLQGAGQRLFFKSRISILDYGDYRIPIDTVVYNNRSIPIYGGKLKNSAGKEQDLFLQVGYRGNHWRTSLSAARVWQKSGFFPGAHGEPDISRVQDDGDDRNIEYPYQQIEHRSLTSSTIIQTPHSAFNIDIGFQQNHRQEYAAFHTHFANQVAPEKDPDLELDFMLRTWSGNIKWNYRVNNNQDFTAGIQLQQQNNSVAGYSFLMPQFEKGSAGLFLRYAYKLSSRLNLNAGVRYDHNQLDVSAYFDPLLYKYLAGKGHSDEASRAHAQRASAVNRTFSDFSWSAGLQFKVSDPLNISLNLGRSFRAPTANELAANGVHHSSFRHEAGSSDLDSEIAYYADLVAEYSKGRRKVVFSPYIYRFSNYIFLKPSGRWSLLPHAGQVYVYTESEAEMMGIELEYRDVIGHRWEYIINGEWISNSQTDGADYPLPLSPPPSVFGQLTYLLPIAINNSEWRFSVNARLVARQDHVARNEDETPGYKVFGASILIPVNVAGNSAEISLKADNLLNAKHFNHLSYYRKVGIPEPGRSIQILINIPF